MLVGYCLVLCYGDGVAWLCVAVTEILVVVVVITMVEPQFSFSFF